MRPSDRHLYVYTIAQINAIYNVNSHVNKEKPFSEKVFPNFDPSIISCLLFLVKAEYIKNVISLLLLKSNNKSLDFGNKRLNAAN